MQTLANIFAALSRLLHQLCFAVAALSMGLIFIVLSVNVFMRYLKLGSIKLFEELPELLFPWLVAACVGIAALHAAHISVRLLIDKVSPAMQKWMMVFCALVTIALYSYCLYIVTDLFPIVKDEKSPILGVSLGTTYAAMSLLFLTLVVDQFAEIFRQTGHLKKVNHAEVVAQGAA